MADRNGSIVTIRDVARLAGVSTSTASLTLHGSDRVNADTAGRVWAAAKELDYRPNPIAQSLKRGHTAVVGMLVGDISSPFSGHLLKATEKRVLARRNFLIVCDSDTNPALELTLLDQLAAQRIGGLILSPHGSGPSYGEKLRSFQMPIVMVDHRYPGIELDFVGSDSRLATAMLTEHLLNLGHRRIAQIAGPPTLYTASERTEGFRQAMMAAGLSVEDDLVVDGRYSEREAYAQTMRLLTRRERPTAIVASNNVMALGALQAIQELGIRCPEDISLAMMDRMPAREVIRPVMTMVEQDVEKIAEIATDYLFDRMGDRGASIPVRETILIPRLVIGTSTAPPPNTHRKRR